MLGYHPQGPGTPSRTRHPRSRHPLGPGTPLGADTTPLHSACWEIRSTSRRYASYWNAILFIYFLLSILCSVNIDTKGFLSSFKCTGFQLRCFFNLKNIYCVLEGALFSETFSCRYFVHMVQVSAWAVSGTFSSWSFLTEPVKTRSTTTIIN